MFSVNIITKKYFNFLLSIYEFYSMRSILLSLICQYLLTFFKKQNKVFNVPVFDFNFNIKSCLENVFPSHMLLCVKHRYTLKVIKMQNFYILSTVRYIFWFYHGGSFKQFKRLCRFQTGVLTLLNGCDSLSFPFCGRKIYGTGK
jgi:hypothetical protein